MFLKELHLIKNDRFALVLVFILPTMVMATMYVAIYQNTATAAIIGESGKSENAIRLDVVDLDTSGGYPNKDLSAAFAQYLAASPDFIVELVETEEEALRNLYLDLVDAYAVIPYGFEGNITNDIPAFVIIHISSTNFESQSAVFSAFSDVVTKFRTDHGWLQRDIRLNRVLEFQPSGNYIAATFGSFMIVFAVFVAVSATAAQAIVGDDPLGRMLLTPATKMEAIVSKTLAYFAVGLVQGLFLLVLWLVLFGIRPNTSLLNIYLILALMSISGSSLGVLISTIVTTRLQANQSFLFILFASLIVGTGFMDVGIVDDVYPINLGRRMIIDMSFKGIELAEFSGEVALLLVESVVLVFLGWLLFSMKRVLA